MTSLTKSLRDGEIKILKALKDKSFKTNKELIEITGLSAPALSENLKMLQKRKMVQRDFESRKYSICTEGLNWLTRVSVIDTIASGSLTEITLNSPPVDSIVALDIPNMPDATRQVFMAGTVNIARACFNQFLLDTQKAKGSESYPVTGRIVYTATIDLGQVQPWRNSEEGKKYLKMMDKPKNSSQ
jgi:DNA-binding transcriptional ArsR family regulator